MAHFPPEIEFYFPEKTAVISLTGTHCELDCAHCGGHYLRGMMPIWQANIAGATSCLISGGCDSSGRVLVLEQLEKVKSLHAGRHFNWHVGLIAEEDLRAITPYTDVVSFDFVADDETIREVYGLDRTVEDYINTYLLLRRATRVIPHITIGLRGGEIGGEYHALTLLQELGLEELVVIVFIPTPGTRYSHRQPPLIEAVTDLMIEARLSFPDKPIYLGCMRPHGAYRVELDCLAIRCGLNKIVSPCREAIQLAEELGLRTVRREECCVF